MTLEQRITALAQAVGADVKALSESSGSAAWGNVTGTLSDQIDLQSALDGKQAADADLSALAALTPAADAFIVGSGTGWATKSGSAARTALGLGGAAILSVGTVAGTVAAGDHTHDYLPLTGGTLTGELTVYGSPITLVGEGTATITDSYINLSGNYVWHQGNDGASSGLDADLLDGNHASAFAAASHTHDYLPLTGGSLTGKLAIDPGTAMSTSGDTYGEYIGNTSLKTYPSTASFSVYPGFSQDIELGTGQTIDPTSPGGFNFVFGINNSLTKSAGSTSDIERLYFTGIRNIFAWADLNTCKQYVGFNDGFNYNGKNANGRISSTFNASSVTLTAPAGGAQTISNIAAAVLFIRNTNADVSYNITSATGYNAPDLRFLGTAGNITATIGSYTAFGMSLCWGSTLSGASSSATITNFYGLRLPPPSSTTNLTIINRWGVYADDPLAKNYLAGNLLVGNTTLSPWATASAAIQVGAQAVIEFNATGGFTNFGSNWYRDSAGAFKYIQNGYASSASQYQGKHIWYTSGTTSGTSGASWSPIAAMTLDTSGYLDVLAGFKINGAATSGQYLRGNGTGFVSSAIQAADIPTLNQNTTGSAGSVAWSGVTDKPSTLFGYGITGPTGSIVGTTDTQTLTNKTLEGYAVKATSSSTTISSITVANSYFTGSATGWTLGTNWAYGTNNAVLTVSSTHLGELTQTLSGIEASSYYLISWQQTHSIPGNCGIRVHLGNASSGALLTFANTSFNVVTAIVLANASGSVDLRFSYYSYTGTGTLTIDSVFVQKLTGMSATVDYKDTAGGACSQRRIAYSSKYSEYLGLNTGQLANGSYNTAFGNNCAALLVGGQGNTAVGSYALNGVLSGGNNVAIGWDSLKVSITSNNTAIGGQALGNARTGSNNVAVGYQAGVADPLTVGSNCTFIGTQSGFGTSTNYDGATAIGYLAKVSSANTVVLGRTTDVTVIGATADDGSGNRLQVTGGIKATTIVKSGSYTVATLPSASTAGAGARAFVTDANSTTFLATAVGGGANAVPVVSNGTSWVIG